MVQLFKASETLNIKEEIYIQTQKEAKEKVKLFSRIKRGGEIHTLNLWASWYFRF